MEKREGKKEERREKRREGEGCPVLTYVSVSHWRDPKNRRKFFDDFSAKRGFDPLLVDNWYLISLKDILEETVLRGRGSKGERGEGWGEGGWRE